MFCFKISGKMGGRWKNLGKVKREDALGIISARIRKFLPDRDIQTGDSSKHRGCKYVGWRDQEGTFHTCEIWFYACDEHVGYHQCGHYEPEAEAILGEIF